MAIWLHFQNSVQKYYCIISSSSWARKWIRIVRNRVTKWRSRCYFSYGFIFGRITPSVTMSPHNDLWWSLVIGNKIRICHTLSRVLTRRRGRHMQRGCWHSSLAQVNWSAQQATAQSIRLYRTGARAARRGAAAYTRMQRPTCSFARHCLLYKFWSSVGTRVSQSLGHWRLWYSVHKLQQLCIVVAFVPTVGLLLPYGARSVRIIKNSFWTFTML